MARIKLAVAAALTSLALAAPAVADPFDISAQKCAENPNLGCVMMADNATLTIGDFISEFRSNTGLAIDFNRVIEINGWTGLVDESTRIVPNREFAVLG